MQTTAWIVLLAPLAGFLIPFEAASLLLLIAAVGAVVLAGRRPEPEGRVDREGMV